MKTKALLIAVFVLGLGAAFYVGTVVGFYRQVADAAMYSSMGGGAIRLEEAKALRKGDIPGALHWIEMNLRNDLLTIQVSEKRIPEKYKESSERLKRRMEEYFNANEKKSK